jgi:hypothetical protein
VGRVLVSDSAYAGKTEEELAAIRKNVQEIAWNGALRFEARRRESLRNGVWMHDAETTCALAQIKRKRILGLDVPDELLQIVARGEEQERAFYEKQKAEQESKPDGVT